MFVCVLCCLFVAFVCKKCNSLELIAALGAHQLQLNKKEWPSALTKPSISLLRIECQEKAFDAEAGENFYQKLRRADAFYSLEAVSGGFINHLWPRLQSIKTSWHLFPRCSWFAHGWNFLDTGRQLAYLKVDELWSVASANVSGFWYDLKFLVSCQYKSVLLWFKASDLQYRNVI